MGIHEEAGLEDLFFILALFERAHVAYWLDGGWGVDVLTGAQRRIHRDVDIDFDSAHTADILNLLRQNGWRMETDQLPCRAELYSPAHGYIDIHPFELLPDGEVRQADLNGSWWNFEPDYFTEVVFAGRTVPCLSAKGQQIFHSGYDWREKDRIDMANLEQFFPASPQREAGLPPR